jgi:hypothetical protein
MFARVCLRLGAALAVASLAAEAGAVTVNGLQIYNYQRADLVAAQGDLIDFSNLEAKDVRAETFEDYNAWNGTSGDANPQGTKVGDFRGIGTSGSGRAKIGDGTKAQVRSDNDMPFGRYNSLNGDLLPDGLVNGNWLDSNDMLGMEWHIHDVGAFNVIAFFLIDVADVGARFSMNIGDSSFADLAGGKRLPNGNIYLLIAALSETVDDLTVQFLNDVTNDGFGIDGAMVAKLAPIPLPPAAALLLAGMAGLAGLRRRRRA